MITAANIEKPDEFYAALVELHAGLDGQESLRLNAALILLLANQIGEAGVLSEILQVARQVLVSGSGEAEPTAATAQLV